MSVYIKNMELPKGRPVCIVIDAAGQARRYDLNNDKYADDELFEAVPVPEHGRLGDLDDFAKRMKTLVGKAENDGFDLGAAWYSAFVRHIELAPTIIPTDIEEEEMK